jgi:hypothetical protein
MNKKNTTQNQGELKSTTGLDVANISIFHKSVYKFVKFFIGIN